MLSSPEIENQAGNKDAAKGPLPAALTAVPSSSGSESRTADGNL